MTYAWRNIEYTECPRCGTKNFYKIHPPGNLDIDHIKPHRMRCRNCHYEEEIDD